MSDKNNKPEAFTHWDYVSVSRTYMGVVPYPRSKVVRPGYYELSTGMRGEPLAKELDIRKDGVCNFVSGPLELIMKEVDSFWKNREAYDKLGVTHKRGILLHGPAGCGKSAIVAAIVKNVVAREGVAILADDIYRFMDPLELFRVVEPETPIIAIMEDIEQYCGNSNEEDLLEILDGSTSVGGGILYLATTNNLDKIPQRIRNRPSRFDFLFKIDYPELEQRREYVDFLIGRFVDKKRVTEVAKKTDKLSLADIKEVVLSNFVYGREIDATIERLQQAKEVDPT